MFSFVDLIPLPVVIDIERIKTRIEDMTDLLHVESHPIAFELEIGIGKRFPCPGYDVVDPLVEKGLIVVVDRKAVSVTPFGQVF